MENDDPLLESSLISLQTTSDCDQQEVTYIGSDRKSKEPDRETPQEVEDDDEEEIVTIIDLPDLSPSQSPIPVDSPPEAKEDQPDIEHQSTALVSDGKDTLVDDEEESHGDIPSPYQSSLVNVPRLGQSPTNLSPINSEDLESKDSDEIPNINGSQVDEKKECDVPIKHEHEDEHASSSFPGQSLSSENTVSSFTDSFVSTIKDIDESEATVTKAEVTDDCLHNVHSTAGESKCENGKDASIEYTSSKYDLSLP